MRRIIVDKVFCKGCGLCVAQCPAQVLEIGGYRNQKGYLLPQAARPQDCTGCLACELICPDLAIHVEKDAHETGS